MCMHTTGSCRESERVNLTMNSRCVINQEAAGAHIDRNNYKLALDFVRKEISELRKQDTSRARHLILALQLSESLLEDEIKNCDWIIKNC